MIEFCLLLPWYVFLFVGTFDLGMYSYSMIATSTAARVSATYCSASSTACNTSSTSTNFQNNCTNYVLGQLKMLPNMGSSVTTCTGAPVTLTISYPAASSCPDGNACTSVTVAYVSSQLVPIPGLLTGQITISRTVEMPLS